MSIKTSFYNYSYSGSHHMELYLYRFSIGDLMIGIPNWCILWTDGTTRLELLRSNYKPMLDTIRMAIVGTFLEYCMYL